MNQKVRVAIIGVGNCASSLVQGIEFYRNARETERIPGIMHANIGGYRIGDFEFAAAFDVSADKVGKDLSEAIFARPNDTYRFCDVPWLGVPVYRGISHEGTASADDIVRILKLTQTDVVINFLPVGEEWATEWYAEQILEAGCGMVNCTATFIAGSPYWSKRFEDAGLPIIGDDIEPQVGASVTHRAVANWLRERGVRVDRTYQFNTGGSAESLNLDQVEFGTGDRLEGQQQCYIRMEGRSFGNVPLKCEVKLEVCESPNAAGAIIDSVRCAKLALDRGIGGPLAAPSSCFMKSPPRQFADRQARALIEKFIHGEDFVRLQETAAISRTETVATRSERDRLLNLVPQS